MILFIFSTNAQNSLWNKIESSKKENVLKKLNISLTNTHTFQLNTNMFNEIISSASLRKDKKKSTIIDFPGLDGTIESFEIYEAPVFAPELSAKYPEIKSYVGISTDDNSTRLRLSKSHNGIKAMISYLDNQTVFIEPVSKKSNEYLVYSREVPYNSKEKIICETIDQINQSINKSSALSKINEGGANNKTLQKFRLAVSTTGEYTSYHGNEIDALAAINNTVARVNEVFERDMAITFEVIANTNLVIYASSASDPYSDGDNRSNWNSELQNTLTNVIGENNYDIGHLFGGTFGGGNAGCIGCVCVNGSKGSGYSTSTVPEGDNFDLDLVPHEIGHQMGANHTFAFTTEGTGVNSEPGSGSTIMSYAGAGGVPINDFVENSADSYFHFHSIKQILNNVSSKSCQTTEAISNNPPIANAGSDYNIPKGTAYILKGSATDIDGTRGLSFCWEQFDSGEVNYRNFGPELLTGSQNRSLPPSGSPIRYVPSLNNVVNGFTTRTKPLSGSAWETVSTVSRTLNWALTVRDRSITSPTGGQSSYDTMQINVEDVAPFTVVNPVSWTQGSNQTIEWNVGQTNNASINCQNVNIYLSTNGGGTFDTTLATNVPNNGAFTFTVPAVSDTNAARILVEAADNIFYDVSDFDFQISSQPTFFITNIALAPIECKGTTASYTFDYFATNGFSQTTVFSVTGIPAGATVNFSPSSLNTSGQVTMTVSNLTSNSQGNILLSLKGTAPGLSKNKIILFPFFNEQCRSAGNTDYNTGITLVQFNTINNSSGKPSGYSDYRSISTDLNRNSSYNLTVNLNTVFSNVTVAAKAWIDWNQNCSFNDPGEEYYLGDARAVLNGPSGNSPFTITVPANAQLGTTEMRISAKDRGFVNGLPTSCDNAFDGEVEDYTLNIMQTLSIEKFGFDNLVVFPNPNKGEFTVKLKGSTSRNINIEIYDITGRSTYINSFKNTGDFIEKIDLRKYVSGVYFMNINDGLRKSTKKIILE
ncbi:zinc-dependent metalloprotease family protein [Litoribaculum gwangyangense]|uniref:Zinc-dependent metalloprotease family protein n=2 Tax=Litoribaculum gwangyangense TaxID=1130722 RepID=A0ABP9CAC0_9FLAO